MNGMFGMGEGVDVLILENDKHNAAAQGFVDCMSEGIDVEDDDVQALIFAEAGFNPDNMTDSDIEEIEQRVMCLLS